MMQCMVHGRSLYAWVTAVQLAAAGHEVTLLCDSEPDDEVRREPRLESRAQALSGEGLLRQVSVLPEHLPATHFLALASSATEPLIERAEAVLASTQGALTLVVLQATAVGTLDALQARLAAQAPGRVITVLALPLFIRTGQALDDFAAPALLLLGEPVPGAGDRVHDALRPYSRQARETLRMPLAAAELTKFAVNAMLASRLSLMNELAGLASRMKVDIELVRLGMAADPRIGPDYLQPGCGFGGPSFTEDLFRFAETLREAGGQPGVLDAVLRINAEQRELPFRQLWRHFGGQLRGRRIAIWGAAYKPGAASVESSAILPILSALLAQGAEVTVHDPKALPALRHAFPQPQVHVAATPLQAAQGADALLLLTAWPEYHNPDYDQLLNALRQPVLIDGRNVFEPATMQALGFVYYGVGRGRA